jgi:hypothetical protein
MIDNNIIYMFFVVTENVQINPGWTNAGEREWKGDVMVTM